MVCFLICNKIFIAEAAIKNPIKRNRLKQLSTPGVDGKWNIFDKMKFSWLLLKCHQFGSSTSTQENW